MRILLLNDFRIGGGAEIIFQKTYEVLVKQGYDVDMVYFFLCIFYQEF